MAVTGESTPAATPRPFDRLLGVFTEVHPGEGARAVTMLANIFLILVSYYIIKTVREPLILTTDVPELAQGARHRRAGRGEDLRRRRPGAGADGLRPRLQLVRVARRPHEAGLRRHGLLRGQHPAVRVRGARGGRSHRRLLLRVGGPVQPVDRRAVLVVRERHLHEGRRQPALPDHRRRHDRRQPGRGVDCRADVPRAPLAAPDALRRRRPARCRRPACTSSSTATARARGRPRRPRRRSAARAPSRSCSPAATSGSSSCCSSCSTSSTRWASTS